MQLVVPRVLDRHDVPAERGLRAHLRHDRQVLERRQAGARALDRDRDVAALERLVQRGELLAADARLP